MPHGQPDFGAQAAKETVYGLPDMGELAARLGSIVTYDRRGDVIFLEDFSGGLTRWGVNKVSLASDALITNEVFRTRGCCCKLITGTNLSGAVVLWKLFAPPVLSRVGFEFSFQTSLNITAFEFVLQLYDGVDGVAFAVHYNNATGLFRYRNSAGAYVDLGLPYQLFTDATMFHTLKLVGDYITNKYIRVLLNNFSRDLSGIDGQITPDVRLPQMEVALYLFGAAPAQGNFYVADVIFTQNEP